MEPVFLSFLVPTGPDPGSVRKRIASMAPCSIVQTFKGSVAINSRFVELIAAQTLSANGTPNLLARKAEVDLLLRMARTTQISRALQSAGARKGEPFIVAVAGPASEVLRLRPKDLGGVKLPARELSSDELERIEAAALLNAQKA